MPTDEEVLEELVADHNLGWVLQELGIVDVIDYILSHHELPYQYDLAEVLDVLEEVGYPPSIIEVLRNHQQCSWLTPKPLAPVEALL